MLPIALNQKPTTRHTRKHNTTTQNIKIPSAARVGLLPVPLGTGKLTIVNLNERCEGLGICKRIVAKIFCVVWILSKVGVEYSPSRHAHDSVGADARVAQEILAAERHLQKRRTSTLHQILGRLRCSARISTNFVGREPCADAGRDFGDGASARLAVGTFVQKSLAIARGALAASDLGERSTELQL